MTNFSLINDLEKGKDKKIDPEMERIRYQQFDITVGNKLMPIEIPIRESYNFEIFLKEMKSIDSDGLKSVLRHFRGKKIRNNDEE